MWLKQELGIFTRQAQSERCQRGMDIGRHGALHRGPSRAKLDQMFRNRIAEPVAKHLSKDLEKRIKISFSNPVSPASRLMLGTHTLGTLLMPNEETSRLFFCYPNGKRQEVYSYAFLREQLKVYLTSNM